jgi:hypothetical protein
MQREPVGEKKDDNRGNEMKDESIIVLADLRENMSTPFASRQEVDQRISTAMEI